MPLLIPIKALEEPNESPRGREGVRLREGKPLPGPAWAGSPLLDVR